LTIDSTPKDDPGIDDVPEEPDDPDVGDELLDAHVLEQPVHPVQVL
jgi:hypothetical protein